MKKLASEKNNSRSLNKITKDLPSKNISQNTKPNIHLPPISSTNKKPKNLTEKVELLETKIMQLQKSTPLQQQILAQMRFIKQQLSELRVLNPKHPALIIQQQQNVNNLKMNEIKIQKINNNTNLLNNKSSQTGINMNKYENNNNNKGSINEQKMMQLHNVINHEDKKNKNDLLSASQIQIFLKQFKLDLTNQLSPVYYGIYKKTLKPIIVKYYSQSIHNINLNIPNIANNIIAHQTQVYTKLWKNIVKAKWVCINKIYDLKQPQFNQNLLVMDQNITHITHLPPQKVLPDIFRIIQFLHQNGYLYRNINQKNFMLNQQQKLVIIDFKNVKRFTDHKGNIIKVHINVTQNEKKYHPRFNNYKYGSNNQLKCEQESRKDDLQSLGYLALQLLSKNGLSWNENSSVQQILKIRSSNRQKLFKGIGNWLQYMKIVQKLGIVDKPDYNKLYGLIEQK